MWKCEKCGKEYQWSPSYGKCDDCGGDVKWF